MVWDAVLQQASQQAAIPGLCAIRGKQGLQAYQLLHPSGFLGKQAAALQQGQADVVGDTGARARADLQA